MSRTAAALAVSSTIGRYDGRARGCRRCDGSAVAVAIQRVAKLFATIATSAAAQAPQAKAKSRFRQGPGSTRSSQRNAAMSSGTGSTARPEPDQEALGAGLFADQGEDDQPGEREQR